MTAACIATLDFDRIDLWGGHVAGHLLGKNGQELIKAEGQATLFKLGVPGLRALCACNPYRLLAQPDEPPNLVSDVLKTWSYRLFHPEYRSDSRRLDCGMVFRETVPGDWIEDVIVIDDADLSGG